MADEGLDGTDFLAVFGLILLFALNVWLINSNKTGDGAASLFLKRKALEEKKKIKKLEQEIGGSTN